MSSLVRRFRVVILLALAGLIAVLGAALHARSSPAGDPTFVRPGDPFNAVTERSHWNARIDAVGGAAAWEELKTAYASSYFGVQHTVAHLFGELLYQKLGLDGVVVCDSTFAFGCYHSFFGTALADKGPGIIKDMDAACLKKFGPLGTGCQHGIGHGLMEFYGHDRLVEALDGCKATTQVNPIFGCTGGVFMEYNVPIILDEENAYTKSRSLDPAHPYAPCDGLPDQFRQSCFYEMGQWWDKVFQGDYKKMGELCGGIETPTYRESCYLGVGNVAAPSSEYDVAATIAKCELMPDAVGRRICRSGASWSVFAEPKVRSHAPEICAGLSEADRIKCAQDSDLIGNGETGQVR